MIRSSAGVANVSLGTLSATRIKIAMTEAMKKNVLLMVDVRKRHFNVMMELVFQELVYATAVGNVLMAATKPGVTKALLVTPNPSSAKAANVCHSIHFVMQ